jgi:hypothetical protein
MAKYVLVMFTNAREGQEDEFDTWYDGQHLHDVVSVPGFSAAQRYRRRIPVTGDLNQGSLAIYEIEAATEDEAKAAIKTLFSTPMTLSKAMDSGATLGGIFESLGPKAKQTSGAPAGSWRLAVMTNAAEGRDDDFNAWYDNVHVPEVMTVDGFATAQRYRLVKTVAGEFQAKYLSIYGLEANDAAGAGAALKAMGGVKFQLTDAMGRSGASIVAFEPTAKVSAPANAAG